MRIRDLHDTLKSLLAKQSEAAKAQPPEKPRKWFPPDVPLDQHYRVLGERMDMDPYVIQTVMKHANITDNPMVLQAFKRFLMTARTALDEDDLPLGRELAKVAEVRAQQEQAHKDHQRDLRLHAKQLKLMEVEKAATLKQLQAAWAAQWDQLVPVLLSKEPKGIHREYTQLNGSQLALWESIRNAFSEYNPKNPKHVEKIRSATPEQISRVNQGLVDRHRTWILDQLIDRAAIEKIILKQTADVVSSAGVKMPRRQRLSDPMWEKRAAAEWIDNYARQYHKVAENHLMVMERHLRQEQIKQNGPRLRQLHLDKTPGYEDIYEERWAQWANQNSMIHYYGETIYHAVEQAIFEQVGEDEFEEFDSKFHKYREW